MSGKSPLGSTEDLIVARLIKSYIMTHQYCTSRQISRFLMENNFGLKTDYTPICVAKVIRYLLHSPKHHFTWFKCVDVEKKNGRNVYFINGG